MPESDTYAAHPHSFLGRGLMTAACQDSCWPGSLFEPSQLNQGRFIFSRKIEEGGKEVLDASQKE